MPPQAEIRYALLPRPLAFDRRAMSMLPGEVRLTLELERQMNAIQRRHQLRDALRAVDLGYQSTMRRPRRPPG
jgi:hypothetical protein